MNGMNESPDRNRRSSSYSCKRKTLAKERDQFYFWQSRWTATLHIMPASQAAGHQLNYYFPSRISSASSLQPTLVSVLHCQAQRKCGMWPKQLKINTLNFKHAIYISLIKSITLNSDELDQCPTKSHCLSSLTSQVQAQRIYKAEWALTTRFKVVWMPYVDTQVQSLLGWYTAIILPCQGLITLAPLPQSISVWRTRLLGFWQLLSGWVSLLWSTPACIAGGGKLSGGHSKRGCCHCYGKITRGFIC